MKAALSSLLSSKSVSLHCSPSSSLSRSIFHSKFLSSPPISLCRKHRANSINFTQIHTGFAPIMAASYKPEQARAPPALSLPTPPVTKARLFLSFIFNFSVSFFYKTTILQVCFLVSCGCSSRSGSAKFR
jgi:omega-amidase